jgi:hypothetical protein
VLGLLRTRAGWPRAVALLVMASFALGLLHAHEAGAAGGRATIAASVDQAISAHADHDHSDDGHDQGQSVDDNCAFCAVVAGKYFLPPVSEVPWRFVAQRIRAAAAATLPRSADCGSLFRPPIAAAI